MHDGSTHIAKYVVHAEGQSWVQVHYFADKFTVGLGPVLDGLQGFVGLRGVGLEQ